MNEPDFNLLCQSCKKVKKGMYMKLKKGKVDHTMICLACEVDKFETIYILKTLQFSEPMMPSQKYWTPYKYRGKIVTDDTKYLEKETN